MLFDTRQKFSLITRKIIDSADERVNGLAWRVIIGLAGLTLCFAVLTIPSVGNDPMSGMLAVQQVLIGKSSSITEYITIDPSDLATKQTKKITFWPPSYQFVPYLLMKTGLTMGAALKSLLIVVWIIGVIGWYFYFRAALSERRLVALATILMMCQRATHTQFFAYNGGDSLIWSMFPWIFVFVRVTCDRQANGFREALSAVAGCAFTLLIVLKYSAAFLSVGVAVGIAWLWWLGEVNTRKLLSFGTGGAIGAGLLYLTGFFDLLAGITPGTAGQVQNPILTVLLFSFAGPSYGVMTYEILLDHLGKVISGASNALIPLLFAAVVQIALLGLTMWMYRTSELPSQKKRFDRVTANLVFPVIAAVSLGICLLLLRGGITSLESRHFWYPGLLLLPYIVGLLAGCVKAANGYVRILAYALLALVLLMPAAHGLVSLVEKSLIRNRSQAGWLTPSGVRNWAFEGSASAAQALESIRSKCLPEDILTVWNTDLAFELADYDLVLLPIEQDRMKRIQFPKVLPRTVRLIVPSRMFEDAELAKTIRGLFSKDVSWESEKIIGTSVFQLITVRSN